MSLSFASDIVPLFRQKDVACMTGRGVLLDDYAYMSDKTGDAQFPERANANRVLAHLTGVASPRMPIGGPYWDEVKLATFRRWLAEGCLP